MATAKKIVMAAAGAGDSGIDTTWDLRVSSAPTGITITDTGTTPSYAFSSTYGFQTAGDTGNGVNFAYPLSGTDALDPTGGVDFLIQATVLTTDRCSDPSIATWLASGGRSAPIWAWAYNNSRISQQLNCNSYNAIYGRSTNDTGAGSLGTSYYHAGAYITLHYWYAPSVTRVYAAVTDASDDWGITGTQLGTRTAEIGQHFGVSNPVYWGLSSDFDNASLGASSTNFTAVRVRSMPNGYNSPGSVPTAP